MATNQLASPMKFACLREASSVLIRPIASAGNIAVVNFSIIRTHLILVRSPSGFLQRSRQLGCDLKLMLESFDVGNGPAHIGSVGFCIHDAARGTASTHLIDATMLVLSFVEPADHID
ncbi:unnamed protein product [Angiostrongylus costaricensis]|uniref:Uncharacterized protein n=1 Tax=Angiostrongylus costaricensis TaxID=334426 RepID=A0A0R3PSI3_ANGCS|nr:unnamed protein product [Angiostrongylus costaricensis]